VIGIIIASYNDRVFLEDCLDSIYTHTKDFKVLVVDDISLDGTCEWLDGLEVEVLHLPIKQYFTRANNWGLDWMKDNVKPDMYLLMNSDVVVTEGWSEALWQAQRELNCDIISTKLLLSDGTIHFAGAYGAGYHYHIHSPNWFLYEPRYVPWVTGAFFGIMPRMLEHASHLPVAGDGSTSQYDASDRRYCDKAWQDGFTVGISPHACYHRTDEAEAMRKAVQLEGKTLELI